MTTTVKSVLAEVSAASLDQAYVKRRLDDWKQRVGALYAQIEHWISSDAELCIDKGRTVSLREDLMIEAGVHALKLPVLSILRGSEPIVAFKPVGLWVIGANGRIDIFARKGTFQLVDVAESFKPPRWKVSVPSKKGKLRSFDKSFLKSIL